MFCYPLEQCACKNYSKQVILPKMASESDRLEEWSKYYLYVFIFKLLTL